MGEHDSDQRIRLVVLGGTGAGKTCLIKRFLTKKFDDKTKPTVEDLYYGEYDLGSIIIKVDILDTAGDQQFPAMRRLSIATANAFLLLYAVDRPDSFAAIKQCVEEIRESRSDFQEIPIMVVGNKSDLTQQEVPRAVVRKEDVAEWAYCELPRMRVKVSECSAKTSAGVMDVFRSFLHLARIPPRGATSFPNASSADTSSLGSSLGSGLKRRSSEYGSGRGDRRPSPSPLRGDRCSEVQADLDAASSQRLKPRSRSLIRRSSKKTSKLGNHGNANTADDCAPS